MMNWLENRVWVCFGFVLDGFLHLLVLRQDLSTCLGTHYIYLTIFTRLASNSDIHLPLPFWVSTIYKKNMYVQLNQGPLLEPCWRRDILERHLYASLFGFPAYPFSLVILVCLTGTEEMSYFQKITQKGFQLYPSVKNGTPDKELCQPGDLALHCTKHNSFLFQKWGCLHINFLRLERWLCNEEYLHWTPA